MLFSNVMLAWVIPLVLIMAGLLGNLVGFAAFQRHKLNKHPTSFMYKSLAVTNTLFLCSQTITVIIHTTSQDQLIFSDNWCKFYVYINKAFKTTSVYILVYISLERLIWMSCPTLKLFKVFNFQKIVLAFLFFLSLFIFSAIFFFSKPASNTLLTEYNCQILSHSSQKNIFLLIDLVYSYALPILGLLLIAVWLLCLIIKSKLKMMSLNTRKDRKKFKKELRFSVTSVLFNIDFIVFNCVPFKCLTVFLFLKETDFYEFFFYFSLISFCSKFYILAYFNPIFRRELYFMFEFKSKLTRHYNAFVH